MGSLRMQAGRFSEDAVESWYRRRGYRVVARNWRCRLGEIDLVLRKDGVLVICEVKGRTSVRFADPHERVDEKKQRKLRVLAEAFLGRFQPGAGQVRFDVASVILDSGGSARIEVFEDAY